MEPRILVVDDSPFIHELVKDILTKEGYKVERAMNGHEAMVSIGENPPSLVLLDIIMPEMSGYQVCRLIRSDDRLKDLPIVMMTAKDTQKDRFWGLEVGADAYITKPIEEKDLLDTLSSLLEETRVPAVPVSREELTSETLKGRADDILERKLMELTIISEVGKLSSHLDRPDVLLQNTLQLISKVIDFDLGAILLAFQGSRTKTVAIRSRNVPLKLSKKQLIRKGSETLSSERGCPVNEITSLDTELVEDSEIQGRASRKAVGSELVVILSSSGRVLGNIMLHSHRSNFFIADDRALINMIGSQLSVLLDNLRLLRERDDQLADLELENSRVEAILRNIGEGVIVTDWSYRIIHANPLTHQLLGIEDDELVGQVLFDHIPKERFSILEEQRIGQANPQWSIRFLSKRGETPLLASVAVVDEEDEQTLGLIILLRDVTSERELDRLKNKFLENVSNHLRNPLTSLKGFSELLREEVYSGAQPRQKEYMDAIDVESGKLSEIVDDLLSLTRIELADYRFSPETFSLPDALLTSIVNNQNAAQAREIALKADVQDNMPKAFADRDSVIDITNRLISNAIKFSPSKTVVTIGAKVKKREGTDSQLEVFVRDEGPGVAKDRRDTIFEKYQSHHIFTDDGADSVGLGLPICRKLVEMNGGQIELISEAQKGSTFLFTLPVSSESP
ncbi:MAG: response regulator [bacterium]|nr:MAG: response regulator [bacterium]